MKRFLLDRQGASNYIEAIITFPIVVVLMIAVINGGMVLFGQNAVEDAARQGARMGSVAQSGAAAIAYDGAYTAAERVPFLRNLDVRVIAPGGRPGSLLAIRVTANVPSFFGRLVPGLSDTFTVSASSTFRQEGW